MANRTGLLRDVPAPRPESGDEPPGRPAEQSDSAATRPDSAATRPDSAATRPEPAATRPEPAATRPEPAGERPGPGHEQAPLAWWHLRGWRVDRHVLARVRDGLHALAPRPEHALSPRPEPLAAPLTAAPAHAEATHADAVHAEPTHAHAEPASARTPASETAPTQAPAPQAPPELTEPAVAAIRATFAIVAEAGDEVPNYFYGQLFARQPRLRNLFPPAMNAQRDRLVKALVQIVESLSTPDEMATYLAQLGRDHRKYGVDAAMYETVGAALLATLRKFAGPAFTPAAEQAWTDAYAVLSALMIEAADEASAAAPAFWPAEVVSIEERFRGMAVLTIALDQGLHFEAGQHVTVQHPRWPRVWRPYSIAGRPREDGLVQLHVKAIPGGWVSNALVHHCQPGSQLTLGPPLGTMTLAPAGVRDLVCVAGGTGLAPIKAIVEQAVRDSSARPRRIHLFCGARRREELYDLADLWRLADAWPGLQVIPVTSDDRAFDGMQGNVGRVAARYLPHADCEAYVAGPPAMVRESLRMLVLSGLPRTRIHYDDALLAGAPPSLPTRR
jgi:NAD(P)H-flavin reductase/hemoglobin-like flavoprotein